MKKENIVMKFWRVVYPVGIYFLISNIISVVFVMIMGILLNIKMMSTGDSLDIVALQEELLTILYKNSMLLTAIAAAITIPIAWLLFRSDRKREVISYKKINPGLFGMIVLLGFSSCLAVNQLLTISRLDILFPGYEKVQQALYGGGIVLEVLAAVILAPIVEELLFRGLVFKRLYHYVGRLPAMIISSLFFGLYHGNVVQGVYACLLGLIFVFVYDKYKTIWAPILAHVVANLTSILFQEVEIFNVFYEKDLYYYTSTLIATLVCIGMIILINRYVKRASVDPVIAIDKTEN